MTPPEYNKQTGYRNQTHPQIGEDYDAGKPLDEMSYYGRDLTPILWQQHHQHQSPISKRLSTSQNAILRSPIPRCKSITELRNLLDEWMKIFDRAFYFQAVRNRCPPVKLINTSQDFHGMYDPQTHIIRINLSLPPPQDYRGTVEEWRICVLLHEMLHAFLILYSCRRRDDGCLAMWDLSMGGASDVGHGPAWANAMTVIQAALRREVRWEVDCGINKSVRHTMSISDWHPRPDQLQR